MKLFLVELQGLGHHYVVADHPSAAYQMVRKAFDAIDYGFAGKRALRSIELLAEEGEYPECKTRLWLTQIDAPDKPATAEDAAR